MKISSSTLRSLGWLLCLVLVASCVSEEPAGNGDLDEGKADSWTDSTQRSEFVGVAQESIQGWDDEEMDIYFIPYNDPEDRIAREIELAQHTIRIAMYNLRSERLGWLLLERQRAGVHVEVYVDQKQTVLEHNTLDDELIAQGLNIIPIRNDRHEYATLHDKLAVIDDRLVFMGSANWGDSALHQNNETLMVIRSTELAQVVNQEIDEFISGDHQPRVGDVDSRAQLFFAPDDRVDVAIERAIDNAEHTIYAAVFSFRLSWLADAMIEAHQRGVQVYLITDRNQSGTTWVDDSVRNAGIPVLEVRNEAGYYTAMHHKFVVIDGQTTLIGSYNWTYTATFQNYEDLALIADDAEVARAFEGEFGRVWQRYAPDQANPITETFPVEVMVNCDGTQWGDELVLVGNIPELGSWEPTRGLHLSGDSWPLWTGLVDLRVGSAFEYKFVILGPDGSARWESGMNRLGLLTTDPNEPLIRLRHEFRY